jgi:hypothetical protein
MTESTPEDARPASTEEAAKIIREDPALRTATDQSEGEADAATDDDARTHDTAPTGESRD